MMEVQKAMLDRIVKKNFSLIINENEERKMMEVT